MPAELPRPPLCPWWGLLKHHLVLPACGSPGYARAGSPEVHTGTIWVTRATRLKILNDEFVILVRSERFPSLSSKVNLVCSPDVNWGAASCLFSALTQPQPVQPSLGDLRVCNKSPCNLSRKYKYLSSSTLCCHSPSQFHIHYKRAHPSSLRVTQIFFKFLSRSFESVVLFLL